MTSKPCPKCDGLAHWNYHFQCWLCLQPGCDGVVYPPDRVEQVATAFVVNSKMQTLLIWHKKYGVWMPPGGHCEPGEEPHETALREVMEEAGLSVLLYEKKNIYENERTKPVPPPIYVQKEQIFDHYHYDFIYFAACVEGDEDKVVTEDNAAWKWADYTSLNVVGVISDDEMWGDVRHNAIKAIDSYRLLAARYGRGVVFGVGDRSRISIQV